MGLKWVTVVVVVVEWKSIYDIEEESARYIPLQTEAAGEAKYPSTPD